MGIRAADREYERWLADELDGAVAEDDLKVKHKKMRESAFAFLRATYWRWAATILDICPDLANAPAVLAVGDTPARGDARRPRQAQAPLVPRQRGGRRRIPRPRIRGMEKIG